MMARFHGMNRMQSKCRGRSPSSPSLSTSQILFWIQSSRDRTYAIEEVWWGKRRAIGLRMFYGNESRRCLWKLLIALLSLSDIPSLATLMTNCCCSSCLPTHTNPILTTASKWNLRRCWFLVRLLPLIVSPLRFAKILLWCFRVLVGRKRVWLGRFALPSKGLVQGWGWKLVLLLLSCRIQPKVEALIIPLSTLGKV